jgi:hypothetical protein
MNIQRSIGIILLYSIMMVSCTESKSGLHNDKTREKENVRINDANVDVADADLMRNDKVIIDKDFINYVIKNNGTLYEDYSLVGPKELLNNFNELPLAIRKKINYICIESEIEEIPVLSGLGKIRRIQLNANGLKRIDNLRNIDVKELIITVNPIESLEPISKNGFVEKLVLTSSNVTSLPNMSEMRSLRELVLMRCSLASLNNIETIPNTIDLNIMECESLDDIDALKYAKIRKLYISKKGLNSIGGKGTEEGLYDRKREWFEKNFTYMKEKNPTFEILFSFPESEL